MHIYLFYLFSLFYSILGRNSSGKSLPEIFMINNTKVDNKVNIANAFNEYFKNIDVKLAGDIHYTGSLSFENYL